MWFWRKKKEEVPLTLQTLYVSGMRLLTGSPFGISIDKVREGKIIKKEFNGRRSRGVCYVRNVPRSIRITYPAPRELILTMFYGLLFAKSYTKPIVMYVEFKRELIKPLKAKLRLKEDVYIPGKRIYNMLSNKDDIRVMIHDGRVMDTLPRNKRGVPIPPTKEMLFTCYNPQTSYGYVFYIANINRVVKHV